MRYANLSEIKLALERGARIESHDGWYTLHKADGDVARLRYSGWRSIFKHLKLVGHERRPPITLPFFIYRLKTTPAKQSRAELAPDPASEQHD